MFAIERQSPASADNKGQVSATISDKTFTGQRITIEASGAVFVDGEERLPPLRQVSHAGGNSSSSSHVTNFYGAAIGDGAKVYHI